MNPILVIDDEQMIRFAFAEFLKDEGCTSLLAENGEQARLILKSETPEVIFLDYRLPDVDGLTLLEEIRKTNQQIPVIFMTAFGTMDVTIKAMQLGAYEYLTKPLDLNRVHELLIQITKDKESLEKIEGAGISNHERVSLEQIVGSSPAMQEVYKIIGLLTTQDITVLVSGESGVGKELVAKAIHDNSPRQNAPFIAINCGALPENLIETEIFGYEAGAFTGAEQQKIGKFEAAGDGTIFLDEIGELQPALQVKLLRVLQEKGFERVGGNGLIRSRARVITATNKDLHEEMVAGRFRQDLFYRLHQVQIAIPALRERKEDIPQLVSHFIEKLNQKQHRHVRGVTDETMQQFRQYSWPGNIRELENKMSRAMVLARGDILPDDLFELDYFTEGQRKQTSALITATQDLTRDLLNDQHQPNDLLKQILDVVEKNVLQEVMNHCQGNQVHAVRILGIHRSTLRKKLMELGL